MSINQSFIMELQHEAANTHKILERIPTEKNDWKPHDKSMKLGNLVTHISDLPTWITMIMTTDELDLASINYKPVIAITTAQITETFDKNVKGALAALENGSDEDFGKLWTLRRGDHVIVAMPKAAVLRSMVLSHQYHHRGQLTVYLRLLDVPVPGLYGPSADDMIAMTAASEATAN